MSHKPFKKLADEVRSRPGAEERLAELSRQTEAALTLAELRKARTMTQEQLARSLDTTQGGVSRMEHQTDLYLSTLRSYVRALGGDLSLVAVFPEGSVSIGGLEELAADPAEPTVAELIAR